MDRYIYMCMFKQYGFGKKTDIQINGTEQTAQK